MNSGCRMFWPLHLECIQKATVCGRNTITGGRMDWLNWKDEAVRMLLEKDALHIYAAILIQLVTAKLSRRSLGDMLPWLAVLGLEMVNEMVDLLRGQEPVLRPWQVVSGVHDIINTMLLPTMLLLLCRKQPALFAYDRSAPLADANR